MPHFDRGADLTPIHFWISPIRDKRCLWRRSAVHVSRQPPARPKDLTHVGELARGPSIRFHMSFEGPGLSVTSYPNTFAEIVERDANRGVRLRPKGSPRLTGMCKYEDRLIKVLAAKAVHQGLLRPAMVHRVFLDWIFEPGRIYFDPEMNREFEGHRSTGQRWFTDFEHNYVAHYSPKG